jgi:helicase
MSEHFIGIERLLEIVRLTKKLDDPLEIIAELESATLEKEELRKKENGGGGGGSHHGQKRGHGRR